MERDYFPRGGAKENPVIQYKQFVFERKKIPKSHKKRKLENTSKGSESQKFNKFPKTGNMKMPHIHPKPNDLRAGFQSICAIHSIFKDRLVVNLPYEMRAYVHHSSISSLYSKLIKSNSSQDLTKMFYVGQLLSCKVIDKISNDKGATSNINSYVSVDPVEVNWNLNSGMVTEHSMVQMVVSSVEDRGYMMECGVAGVMAFLPFQQAIKYAKIVLVHKEPLAVGTVIWCYVEKSNENSSGSKFIEVSVCHDITFEQECITPSTVLQPGSRVNTTITKVFEDGCCQVSVDGTEISGTVHVQLDFNKDLSQDYFVGTSVKATVMTYSPLSDLYNFSFSHQVYKPLLAVDRAFKQKCIATVDHIDKYVIYLTLDEKQFKGIVPIKSMLKKQGGKHNKEDNKDSQDSKNVGGYSLGDCVKVEIANINLITRKYICSIISKIDPKQYEKIKLRRMNKMKIKSECLSDDSDFDIKFEPDLDMDSVEIKEEVLSSDCENDSGIDTSKYPDNKSKKKKNKEKKRKPFENEDGLADIKIELDSDIEIKEEDDSDDERLHKINLNSKKRKDLKLNESNQESPLSLFANLSKKRKNSNVSCQKNELEEIKIISKDNLKPEKRENTKLNETSVYSPLSLFINTNDLLKKIKKSEKVSEDELKEVKTKGKDKDSLRLETRKDKKLNGTSQENPCSLLKNPNDDLSKKRKSLNESLQKDKTKKVKNNDEGDKRPTLSETIRKKVDAVSQLSLEQVDSQFLWDATPEDLAKVTSKEPEEFKEDSDEESVTKKPLTKKQKKTNEIEKERKIREKEDELMKALEEPKSADHYERLILSRPEDSRVWIKYMAFHLEATEIEKARAVGNRALKLITHRSEQDRLNIWLALLNLEHLYGSKELFKDTWTEALKFNDDYKVNCKVLDLFAASQNTLEVNILVQRMVKQYRENMDCWLECLSALMSASMEEKARDLLQRALKSLPTKNHVALISRFALIENSHGHSEEAQALFDNLLTSYPARVDLWFVYVDMLVKSNQMDLTRQVLERATSLKLPAKKMKSLYKKWLDFEEKHGNEEMVETVRKSAIQYVEQATKEIGA